MARRSQTYKGHTIIIDEEADPPLVTIDGKPIRVFKGATGWFTTRIASNYFASLDDLARNVIAHGLIPE